MYRTIAKPAVAEFTEKRSRFIGYVRPVTTEEEAAEMLAALRKEHWDARHHVSAFVLREGHLHRCSDDGEPQGTAGMPTLDVLQKRDLCDCAVVVVRYFGGILLGGGGLVRAYGRAASLAVEAAGIVEMREATVGRIACTYAQYGWVAPLIAAEGGTVDGTSFTDGVELTFTLPQAAWGHLAAELTEKSAGTLSATAIGETFLAVSVPE